MIEQFSNYNKNNSICTIVFVVDGSDMCELTR